MTLQLAPILAECNRAAICCELLKAHLPRLLDALNAVPELSSVNFYPETAKMIATVPSREAFTPIRRLHTIWEHIPFAAVDGPGTQYECVTPEGIRLVVRIPGHRVFVGSVNRRMPALA